MTNEVETIIDKDNIANMDFSKQTYPYIDGLGFAQSKGML